MIAPVTKLAEFRGQWGSWGYWNCFMCRGHRYHTEEEHNLIMASEGEKP